MNPQTPPPESKSSPWNQPVMWLVLGMPAAVVIAGIIMIVIAGRGDSIDTVPDQVRRTAQIQTADLSPDQFASDKKLSGIMHIDPERNLVEVLPVTGDFDHSAPLRLQLVHPARQEHDRDLLLQPTELGWRIDARVDVSHDWDVRLGPGDAHWRLQGHLPKGQLATHLHPRLQTQ